MMTSGSYGQSVTCSSYGLPPDRDWIGLAIYKTYLQPGQVEFASEFIVVIGGTMSSSSDTVGGDAAPPGIEESVQRKSKNKKYEVEPWDH